MHCVYSRSMKKKKSVKTLMKRPHTKTWSPNVLQEISLPVPSNGTNLFQGKVEG